MSFSRYRVTVRGSLRPRFAEAFPGMRLEAAAGATTLTGDLLDQSQLYAILEQLQRLGLELVAVETPTGEGRSPPCVR